MRRLTAWIGGAVGGITAYRLLRRRPQVAAEPFPEPAAPETDDPAEELRAKLAQSRGAGPAPEPLVEEEPAPPEPAVEDEPESPEDRRRRVHEEGRAALDDMHSD